MESLMLKIFRTKLVRLRSARRLTRGGDMSGSEQFTLRKDIG
jgi:hypothetical protein